jgi:hypothetical protein
LLRRQGKGGGECNQEQGLADERRSHQGDGASTLFCAMLRAVCMERFFDGARLT